MKLQLAVLLISVLLRGSTAMPAVDHCLTKFEESLKETLGLRRSCNEANLKDCCQVRYYWLSTDNYSYNYYSCKIIGLWILQYRLLYTT